jgi:CheY-like chemotaxis protein
MLGPKHILALQQQQEEDPDLRNIIFDIVVVTSNSLPYNVLGKEIQDPTQDGHFVLYKPIKLHLVVFLLTQIVRSHRFLNPTPLRDTLKESTLKPSLDSVKRQLRFVLADDNHFVRKVVRRQLHTIFSDCQTDECDNGAEALEKVCASHDSYHCLILDNQMPCLDGLEATRRIRAFEKEKRLGLTPILRIELSSCSSANRRL